MTRDELLEWVRDPENMSKYRALRNFKLATYRGAELWFIDMPIGAYKGLYLYVKTGNEKADCKGEIIINRVRKGGFHGGYLEDYAHAKKYILEWAEIINRQGG